MEKRLVDMKDDEIADLMAKNDTLYAMLGKIVDDDKRDYLVSLFDKMPECILYEDVFDHISLDFDPMTYVKPEEVAQWLLTMERETFFCDTPSELVTVIEAMNNGHACGDVEKLSKIILKRHLDAFAQYANDWDADHPTCTPDEIATYITCVEPSEALNFYVDGNKVYRITKTLIA